MLADFFKGIRFLTDGITLVLSPGFRRYIVVPIIVNLLLLSTLITVGFIFFSDLLAYLSTLLTIPSWIIIILGWLLGIIFFLVSAILSVTFFSIITTTLAAPFYGLLSEKIEAHLKAPNEIITQTSTPPALLSEALPFVRQTIYREIQKMAHFIPWIIVGLIAFFFPLTLPISAIIWFLISAWTMCIQYIDYAADNEGIPFSVVRDLLKQNLSLVMGFGIAVTLLMSIPILNLIIPPASVAGGTKLWLALKKNCPKQH